MVSPFIEPGFGSGRVLGGRQVEEGEEVAGFEMRAGFLEVGLTLGIDEGGGAVGEHAGRIGRRTMALRLNENGPAGAEAPEGVVETAGVSDQLSRHGAVEVGPAEACGALQAAVLRSEEHTSELQSLMRISYAVFCLKKKK